RFSRDWSSDVCSSDLGAQFVVSPGFDEGTARLCNRYQVPYIPGCMTVSEMIRAMECGAEVIKLFPGAMFDPSVIRAIKGPLPQRSEERRVGKEGGRAW